VRLIGKKKFSPLPLLGKGVNLVIERGNKCQSTPDKEKSAAVPMDEEAGFDGRGTDTSLWMDTCEHGAKDLGRAKDTPFDVLMHEIIHNLHYLQGLADKCKCCEELRTVGLEPRIVGKPTDHIMPRTSYKKCKGPDEGSLCKADVNKRKTCSVNANDLFAKLMSTRGRLAPSTPTISLQS